MKKLITISLVLLCAAGFAQPGSYTPGTQVNWNFNGRDHGFFMADDNGGNGNYIVIISGTGDGETSWSNLQNNSPQKLFNDAGTNHNGKFVMANGDTVRVILFTITAVTGYGTNIANDINYFWSHITDTFPDSRIYYAGLSGGVARTLAYLTGAGQDVYYDGTNKHRWKGWIALSGCWQGSAALDSLGVTSVAGNGKWGLLWTSTTDATCSPGASDQINTEWTATGVTKYRVSEGSYGHSGRTWDSCWSVARVGGAADSGAWPFIFSALYETQGNLLPTASAGSDQTLTLPDDSVHVDGSASNDPDGSIVSYVWSKVSGPATYTIATANQVATDITNLVAGTYVFRLTVTDDSSATATDDVTITVNSAPGPNGYKLTFNSENCFALNGGQLTRQPERAIDGNTATNIDISGGTGNTIYYPNRFLWMLDSAYNYFKFRVYTGSGSPSATFWLYNADFTDSASVTLSSGLFNSWNWVDTATTKGVTFAVRAIQMNTSVSINIGEIEAYGITDGNAPVQIFPEKTQHDYNVPYTQFQGANINGDEPDSLFMPYGSIRLNGAAWYYDTMVVGATLGNHQIDFYRFGGDFSASNKQLADSGKWVYPYINGASAANMWVDRTYIPGTSDYAYYDAYTHVKNIPKASDSTDPAEWADNARIAAAWAIVYGPVVNASLLDNYDIVMSGGAILTTGLNYAKAFADGNEADMNWNGVPAYNAPQVKIAGLSASRDSIDAKVPGFPLMSGALTFMDTGYIKAMGYWSYRYRGFDNFPAQYFEINHYLTHSGAQGQPTDYGISPEQFRLYERWVDVRRIQHKYLGNVQAVWSENGYDASQYSIYKVPIIPGQSARRSAAILNERSYHEARAAGVSMVEFYRSRDETANPNNPAAFVTMGSHTGYNTNSDSSFKKWPWWYSMATMLNVYRNYSQQPTLIHNGDSTGLWIMLDSATISYDTATYTLYMGTIDGSDTTFTLDVGSAIAYVERVDKDWGATDLQGGNPYGSRSNPSFSGSTVSLTVGETPVSLRVVYASGSTPVNNGYLRLRKFRKVIKE